MTGTLLSNEVHIWDANVDDFDLAELQQLAQPWLTRAEKTRLSRFYFAEHKKQLLLGRVLLRRALSNYESLAIDQWQLCYNDYGKPMLEAEQQRQLSHPLYFNLSHSRGILVLAVSRLADIGVDIESNTRARRVRKIAARYFSAAEVSELLALEPSLQQGRFYDLWSLKEAYIKACGMGLAIDLRHFSFSFSQDRRLSIDFDEQRFDKPCYWQFWQLEDRVDFNIALAAKSATGRQIQQLKKMTLKQGEFFESSVKLGRVSFAL